MTQKQDESKKRILEAAKICFAAEGFKGTSIRKICETADANLALVSYYYGSKEKLYFSVIEYLYHDIEQKLGKLNGNNEPRAALIQFITIFLNMRSDDKQFHMILRHELSSDSSRTEIIRSILTPLFDRLRSILTEGKKQNIFHFDSLDRVLTFIVSVLIYPVYDSFLIPIPNEMSTDVQKDVEETANFILAGLHCPL